MDEIDLDADRDDCRHCVEGACRICDAELFDDLTADELVAAIRWATTETVEEIDKLWENPGAAVNVEQEDILGRYFDRIKRLLED